jgi:hypothetical protein
MKNSRRTAPGGFPRLGFLLLLSALLAAVAAFWPGARVEANHPVLVEGNCDSPVPGTTLVAAGACGDYDGDGRIGTAEDTDGADRIFGTLNAALGPGTGASAGTGANYNGLILIVTSGRFSENLYIGESGIAGNGSATPGNVTLEAAPGVEANIDAVFQGDPAGGNDGRQGSPGIVISYGSGFQDRTVTLRNLRIRNFADGVWALGFARVNIDNCVFENNLEDGLLASESARVSVNNSQFIANGLRIGTVAGVTPNGHGIRAIQNSQVRIRNTTISHSLRAGIFQAEASNVAVYRVKTYFNAPDLLGVVTVATDPNFSQ